jgi:hypothetical protein
VRSPAASFLTPRTARSALGGGLDVAEAFARLRDDGEGAAAALRRLSR